MHDLLRLITKDDYLGISDAHWPSYEQLLSMSDLPDFITNQLLILAEYKHKQHQSRYFCSLAFYGVEYTIPKQFNPKNNTINNLRCCGGGDVVDKVRKDMLTQKKSKECSRTCWDFEDQGVKSLRQIMNSTLDIMLNKDIAHIFEDSRNGPYEPLIYKIEPSNICNATCFTCNSSYSSAWGKLESKNGATPDDLIHWVATDQGFSDGRNLYPIYYQTAKIINFLGGEPTLNKECFKILKYLVDANNVDCNISFTTNGTFCFNQDQIRLLKQFKSMQFNFSIDGIGPVAEYLRYPIKWDHLQKKLKWCRDHGFEISVNITVSNLNIYYFDELILWLTSNQIHYRIQKAYTHNKQYSTRCFESSFEIDPRSLSQKIKQAIKDRNKHPLVHEMLNQHSDIDDYWYQQFLLEIIKQDRWKGIKIQDYLGEFAQLIQEDLNQLLNSQIIPIKAVS